MSKDSGNSTSKGLMWKLLKKHISPSQLVGFSLASLIGLTIVILAVQFHQDVRPIFNDEESFIRKDYLIITKAVSTAGTLLTSRLNPGAARWASSRAMTTASMPRWVWEA